MKRKTQSAVLCVFKNQRLKQFIWKGTRVSITGFGIQHSNLWTSKRLLTESGTWGYGMPCKNLSLSHQSAKSIKSAAITKWELGGHPLHDRSGLQQQKRQWWGWTGSGAAISSGFIKMSVQVPHITDLYLRMWSMDPALRYGEDNPDAPEHVPEETEHTTRNTCYLLLIISRTISRVIVYDSS